MICDVEQCYFNQGKRCLKEDKRFYCNKGRDSVKIYYEDDVNVAHSGNTIKMSRITAEVKGRYALMLENLKGDRMYYAVLEDVIKAGIDKLWFEWNARRGEI